MEPSGTPVSRLWRTPWMPVLLVTSWLGVCLFAYWWYEYRHWQAYPEQLVQFDSQRLSEVYPILNSSNVGKALVVHFADENCPCEAYRVAHVNNIQRVLADTQQVTLNQVQALSLELKPAASPSVAIWSEAGELAYFGPYSSGMTCGSGFDFVSMVFSKLKDNVNPHWVNTQGFGCFCSW